MTDLSYTTRPRRADRFQELDSLSRERALSEEESRELEAAIRKARTPAVPPTNVAKAAPARFPYMEHRTMADVWRWG